MELPKCQKCNGGLLIPLSDYGQEGATVLFKAWVCTNPDCGFSLRIEIENAKISRRRLQQSRQAFDRRRFSSAVRAEKAVETAARNGEIDPIDGDEIAEDLAKAAGLNGEGRGAGDEGQDYSSRCTVSGENAGRQIATYSAPPGSGVL